MAFGLRVTAALLLVVVVYSFSLTRLTRKGRATSILSVEQKGVRDYSISGAYPRPLIGDEEPKEAIQSDQTSPVEDEVLKEMAMAQGTQVVSQITDSKTSFMRVVKITHEDSTDDAISNSSTNCRI